jgi:hypothetical protein
VSAEFKECRLETDAKKLAIMHEKVVRGLSQIKKYTSMDRRSSAWSIDLEKDPLG